MADYCCIVELKETIGNMNAELGQSHTKISELDAKVRGQEEGLLAAQKEMAKLQEGDARLARDLKEEIAQLARDLKEGNTQLARDLKEEIAQLARDLKEENAHLTRDLKEENARFARDLKEENARLAKDLKEENAQISRDLIEENARLARDLKSEDKCRAVQERLDLAEQKLAQFSQKSDATAEECLAQVSIGTMADSCCIVELKESIAKVIAELIQSHTKISELNAKVREQEECLSAAQKEMRKLREENARLARDLKEKPVVVEESTKTVLSETSNLDCLALKDEGNALYSAGDFLAAVQKYSKGLEHCTDKNTDRSTLLKNRAAAYLNLREYQKVVDDTTAALEITPSDIKALYRRCQAYEQLGKYNEAFEDARAVNHLNPQSSAIQPYLRRLQEIVNASNDDALDFNSLPNEIILKIFGYLKQNQLGEIARVCKSWNVLTKSPVLWKRVNVKIFPFYMSEIIKIESFINTLPSCVMSIRLDLEECEDCLLLDFLEFCVKLQQKCPHLEELSLYNCKLSHSLPSVIDIISQRLQDVKKLVFHDCLFSYYFVQLGGTSGIEVLDLFSYNCPGTIACIKKSLLFSRMPCLKVLCLHDTDADDTWFEDDTSFFNQLHFLNLGCTSITARTFQAIQTHGLNLKELYLCLINLQDHDITFNKSLFPHLKTICVCCCDLTCESVVSLIRSCPSLQNLYVEEGMAKSLSEHPFLVANRCKSEIVKVVQQWHDHIIDYSHY